METVILISEPIHDNGILTDKNQYLMWYAPQFQQSFPSMFIIQTN